MRTKREDIWKPQPGSWEEVVEPYEVQLKKCRPEDTRDKHDEFFLAVKADQAQEVRLHASV